MEAGKSMANVIIGIKPLRSGDAMAAAKVVTETATFAPASITGNVFTSGLQGRNQSHAANHPYERAAEKSFDVL